MKYTKNIVPVLTWGVVAWLILSSVLSMYTGGWVSGYLVRQKKRIMGNRIMGIISGMMTSSISLLILFIAATLISGTLLSTTFIALNRMIVMTGSIVAEGTNVTRDTVKMIQKVAPEFRENVNKVLPNLGPVISDINENARELLPKDNEVSEEKLKEIKSRLEFLMEKYLHSFGKGDVGVADDIEKEFRNFLVEITGKNSEEIREMMDTWKNLL